MSNQISSSEICIFSVHGIFHTVNFHNNKVHKSFAHGSQYLFLLLCGKEIIEKLTFKCYYLRDLVCGIRLTKEKRN